MLALGVFGRPFVSVCPSLRCSLFPWHLLDWNGAKGGSWQALDLNGLHLSSQPHQEQSFSPEGAAET